MDVHFVLLLGFNYRLTGKSGIVIDLKPKYDQYEKMAAVDYVDFFENHMVFSTGDNIGLIFMKGPSFTKLGLP